MKKYKTHERQRLRAKQRREAVKARGGAEYKALLEKERLARAAYRVRHPDYWRKSGKDKSLFKTNLCSKARARGREKGIEATIKPSDIVWPSHCPVLGIELYYPERIGEHKDRGGKMPPNYPSLDRWDCTKGYVPGNVFVISFRANTLKNNVKRDEILRVAKYVMSKPRYAQGGALCLPLFQ